MSIPFTQFMRPDGRKVATTIARPQEIEALAEQFIRHGGEYHCEHLATGEIAISAAYEGDDIAMEVCENGPAVRAAVDKVVRQSHKWTAKA